MSGYTRNDTGNNIADGNVINASDLDGEFDAIEGAFNASTGHTHDGTSAEGAPIEVAGPAQDLVITATEVRPKTDNTLDLGTTALEFKDAFFDGTVKTDTLTVDENATVTGNLTVNGNTTLGNAATDTVTVTADVASDLIPSADGTYDLGASGSEWQDLYIDGTANIDSLVADTADINAGSIDGVTLGTNSAVTSAVITTADINGGTIDDTTIGGSTPAAGSFTTVTGSGDMNIDSGTLFVDASENRVGVGTASPASVLEVKGGGGDIYQVTLTDVSDNVGLKLGQFGTVGEISGTAGIDFEINEVRKMRIDSDGNLLVRKTELDTDEIGVELRENGKGLFTADGTDPVFANRLTSDGDIVKLAKDGTTVGSIGTRADAIYIGRGDTGISFTDNDDAVYPVSPSGLVTRDAAIDLGIDNTRFKDLYLSGGVYLGGTGAGNKLDDYEEGSWTPAYEASSGSFDTLTYSSAGGNYRKIGDLVFVEGAISTSSVTLGTASGALSISGLPFTSDGPTTVTPRFARRWNLASDAITLNGGMSAAGQTSFSIVKHTMNSVNTTVAVEVSEMTTGSSGFRNEYYFSLVYKVQ